MSTIKIMPGTLQAVGNYLQHFSAKAREPDQCVICMGDGQLTFEIRGGNFSGKYVLRGEEYSSALEACVSLRFLLSVAKTCHEDEEITIELYGDQGKHVVRVGRARYVVPARNMPRAHIIENQGMSVVDCDGELIHRAAQLVAHSVSKVEPRVAALQALHIDISVERFSVVASDGSRLAVVDKRRPARKEGEPELGTGRALLHRDFLGAFFAVIESKAPVTLRFSDRSVEVMAGRRWASFPQFDGKYPTWRKAVADQLMKRAPAKMVTTAGVLQSIVRQVGAFVTKEVKGAVISGMDGRATVRFDDTDVGGAEVEIMTTSCDDFPPTLLSIPFVRESLMNLDPDKDVTCEFRGHESPVVIVSGRYRSVIMPMALNEGASSKAQAMASTA